MKVECQNFLDKIVKSSRVTDREGLCIIQGRLVWSVTLTMHLLNDDGNMFDAIFLAAIMAIKNTQVPDVSLVKNQICINDQRRKYLNVHHLPVCSTFYFLGDCPKPALDVTTQEEKLAKARLSIVLNSYGDLCGMQTLGALNIGPNNQVEDDDEDSETMQPVYDASELLDYIKIA